MIKDALRAGLRALGYDLRRFTPGADSFHEIALLLAGSRRPVIFDVGAHHGETAQRFISAFPDAALYCFEPFPDSYRELSKNAAGYKDAILEAFGFSDQPGAQEFYSNQSSPTNSLLRLAPMAAETWRNDSLRPSSSVRCEFATIDCYLAEKGISSVDLLKLDVQGAEYRVLRGADRSLREGRIRNIYLEIIVGRTYEGQKSLGEYLSLLDSFGFRVQGLFNFEHGPNRELIQLDGLFSRRPV